MRVETVGLSEWERALPESGAEVFHFPDALAVLDDHFDGELQLFGGFKGQQPIALLPVFVQRRSVGTAVLSPPPGMGVPRLGPVLMPTSPKRRKQEKINQEFTEAVLSEVGADLRLDARLPDLGFGPGLPGGVLDRADIEDSLTVFRMVCNTAYADPRPYLWDEFDLDPYFTYHLDVASSTPDELLKSFSQSLRREIRDGQELDVTVEREGIDAVETVFRDTRNRYTEQGVGFEMDWPYVRDLWTSLDDRSRVYVARDSDGEFLSGVTVLYSNDAAYFWQGGNRAIHEGVSINSLLHWHVISDLVEDPPRDSITTYDLMGANTERLCRYKSKFGAELVPYYVVESSGVATRVAKKAYSVANRKG